jgi:hypothetical protein
MAEKRQRCALLGMYVYTALTSRKCIISDMYVLGVKWRNAYVFRYVCRRGFELMVVHILMYVRQVEIRLRGHVRTPHDSSSPDKLLVDAPFVLTPVDLVSACFRVCLSQRHFTCRD